MFAYSLSAVVFSMGLARVTGAGEGGLISLEKKDDDYEFTVMQDGVVIRSYKGSDLWIATITVAQTSQTNDVLSAIRTAGLAASKAGQGGVDIMPAGLVDTNGTTLIVSDAASIMKPPKVVRANKPNDHEWMIALTNAQAFIGGQTS